MSILRTIGMASLGAALSFLIAANASAQTTIYVDQAASGAGDGVSWPDAFTNLQDALAAASAGDEIRVAQGIYRPDVGENVTPGDRAASFVLVDSVALLGGFAGVQGDDPDDRDFEVYESILCGDIGVEDRAEDNSYHVVRGKGLSNDTVIEGFTIRHGYADDAEDGRNLGGGMNLMDSSPQIRHCLFTDNYAAAEVCYPQPKGCVLEGAGGSLFSAGGAPLIESSTFRNSASSLGAAIRLWSIDETAVLRDLVVEDNTTVWGGTGGGLYLSGVFQLEDSVIRGNQSNNHGGGLRIGSTIQNAAVIENCLFEDNATLAFGGGGVSVTSTSPTFINCTFRNNVSLWFGGGMSAFTNAAPLLINCKFLGNHAMGAAGGGGFHVQNASGFQQPTFVNCLFAENTADASGAALTIAGTGAHAKLINCTVAFNQSVTGAGGLHSGTTGSVTVHNSILWGNTNADGGGESAQIQASNSTVSHSNIEGWSGVHGGAANFGADPLFANPDTGDYRPLPESPCIDAGDNASVPDGIEFDLAGNPRFMDGLQDGNVVVDIGAYELDPDNPPHAPVPGDLTGDGTVGVADLLILINAWGACDDCDACPADLTGDCSVGVPDLLILIGNWG